MSSDTESTVCDPRSEVAPEPQVPKGPGQIRRVPQLFTATARPTPVVPPQVQQGGTVNGLALLSPRVRVSVSAVALLIPLLPPPYFYVDTSQSPLLA